jgi:hypothetical protein
MPQAEMVGQMIIFGEWCREPAKTGERVHLMFCQLLVMSGRNGKLYCAVPVENFWYFLKQRLDCVSVRATNFGN